MAINPSKYLAYRPDFRSYMSYRPDAKSASKHITKARFIVLISLAITWWVASLLPHYSPMIQAGLKSRLSEAREKMPKLKVDWKVDDDPRAKYDQRKVALIVEPRPLPHLVPQMLHMISVVPPDWRFVFVGSEKSVVGLGRAQTVKHQQIIGKLDLLVLPEPWSIESKEHIFRTLTDMRFYDEFLPGVEWIMKYEADSILCANSPHSLNQWLGWSWAGAPRKADDHFGGNGGLSIRRVSAIRRVLSFQQRYNDTEPEDEWFGKRLWVLPGEKVATGQEGVFAVEDIYYENPMGFHLRGGGKGLKDDVWKNPERRRTILEYCPEVSMILDMKLEKERCSGDDGQGNIVMTDANLEAESRKLEAELKKLREDQEKKAKEAEAARKKMLELEAQSGDDGDETSDDQHNDNEKEKGGKGKGEGKE